MNAKLFDFESFKSIDDIERFLGDLGNKLFYDYELVVNGKRYSFTQLNLFIHQKDIDNISNESHKNPMQMTSGRFYIHKTSKNNQLKSPKLLGLDITCGQEYGRYGGLFIRALKDLDSHEEIIGPAKVLSILIGNEKKLSKPFSDNEKLTLYTIDGTDEFDNEFIRIQKSNNTVSQICKKSSVATSGGSYVVTSSLSTIKVPAKVDHKKSA